MSIWWLVKTKKKKKYYYKPLAIVKNTSASDHEFKDIIFALYIFTISTKQKYMYINKKL